MAVPKIIDQWGNPMERKSEGREFAAPTMGGVRSVWTDTVLSGLDPTGLAELLRQASRGYPDRFFILAEEMEERDLHYAAVLGTRKRAITGVEPMIVAASSSKEDEFIAAAVRDNVTAQPGFVDDYITDLSDALGKGYSMVETVWEKEARKYWPGKYIYRPQLHFIIDQVDGRTLRMKHVSDAAGVELPPFCFSIHRPKLKSGLPIRGGLARLAAWAFLFKSYTLKDWLAFIEVYGMPLRIGKYQPGALQSDMRVLLRAVRELSTDAAAIIPKNMEIELVEAAGTAGNAVFSQMAEYLDKQVSKGVLGQTMTTDDGSSLGQAAVHENVRHDIARADARQMAVTVNRDLIRPYVDFNFGPQQTYPTFLIPITESEDIRSLVDAITRLVPLGLEVSMPEVRERIGFEEPEEGVVMMAVSKGSNPALDKNAGDGPPADPDEEPEEDGKPPVKPEKKPAKKEALARACPNCGGTHALAASEVTELDELVEEALGHWQKDIDPLFKPLKTLFEQASSYEELSLGLEDLSAKLEAGPMADRLAKVMMLARGLGDIGEGL